MILRIALVVAIAAVYSFYQTYSIHEKETLNLIQNYSQNRVAHESELFMMAEKNGQILRETFLQNLQKKKTAESRDQFAKLFVLNQEDNVYRLRSSQLDVKKKPSVVFLSAVDKTDLFQKSILSAYEVATQLGPAFHNKFYNTYFSLFGNDAAVMFLPGVDYASLLDLQGMLIDQESETIANPFRNPQRKTKWTSLYFDDAVDQWMVSVTTPIDFQGQWIGGVSHDVLLDDLIERSKSAVEEGSYNLIFNQNGDLLISQKHQEKIIEKGGKFNVLQSNDKALIEILQTIQDKKTNNFAGQTQNSDFYIGVAQIEGPGWYFVTVYPQKLIALKSLKSVYLIVLITVLSLLIDFLIISYVLRVHLQYPFENLLKAIDGFLKNEKNVQISHIPNNDFGIIALKFNQMSAQVRETMVNLEKIVEDRTTQLKTSYDDLNVKTQLLNDLNMQKNEFIGVASHDLKNPLSTIQALSSNLVKNYDNLSKEKILIYMEKIERNSKRMMNIVTNILDVNAIEEGRKQIHVKSIVLYDLCREIVDSYSEQSQLKQIDVSLQFSKPIEIVTDRDLLYHVIDNLFSNALKYSPVGGRVDLIVDHVQNFGKAHKVRISFRDRGEGIQPEELPRLFGKYTQLSSRPTGGESSTGLGLSIAKTIVEYLKGSIWCESQIGQGSTFIIELPSNYNA